MEWYSEVVGLPAVNIEDSKKIGIVKDLVFNQQSGEITGLVIENSGLFCSSYVMPLNAVVTVCKDSIAVKSAADRAEAESAGTAGKSVQDDTAEMSEELSKATAPGAKAPGARAPEARAPEARAPEARAPEASEKHEPAGKSTNCNGKGKSGLAEVKVVSENGEAIGIVRDFLFSMETGVIEGFELSDGIVEDLMKGRRLLPLLGKVIYRNDGIIVSPEAVNEIVDTGGGLMKKRFNERENIYE